MSLCCRALRFNKRLTPNFTATLRAVAFRPLHATFIKLQRNRHESLSGCAGVRVNRDFQKARRALISVSCLGAACEWSRGVRSRTSKSVAFVCAYAHAALAGRAAVSHHCHVVAAATAKLALDPLPTGIVPRNAVAAQRRGCRGLRCDQTSPARELARHVHPRSHPGTARECVA